MNACTLYNTSVGGGINEYYNSPVFVAADVPVQPG